MRVMISQQKMGSSENGRDYGSAHVLAIGTATPPNCIYQDDYPDYFFRVTKSEHKTTLKDKFKRACEKSGIKKRYTFLTEDILEANPNLTTYRAPSFDTRQKILNKEIPKLAAEAASRAIQVWGQPASRISHLLFCSSSGGFHLPNADFQLSKLLGLKPNVQRATLFAHGCYGGGSCLRLAKDIVENNSGSRLLFVCCESMISTFHAPSEDAIGMLIGSAIFGDGAAAVIVGANPSTAVERPLFELVKGTQVVIPDSEDMVGGFLNEMGWDYDLKKALPQTVADNIRECLEEPLGLMGKRDDLNGLFYVLHPAGPAFIDKIEAELGLDKDKFKTSRRVLSEYGNPWSPGALFVLEEMRRKSVEDDRAATTGEGLELGLLLTFGPGLTCEVMVLRSCPT